MLLRALCVAEVTKACGSMPQGTMRLQVTKTAHKLLMAKFKSHLLTEEKTRRAAEKALKKQSTDAARAKKQSGRKRKLREQESEAAGAAATASTHKQPSDNGYTLVSPANRNNDGSSTSHAAMAAMAAQQAPEGEDLDAAAELLEDDVAVEEASAGPPNVQGIPESEHSSEPESEESACEVDLDAMVGEGGEPIICQQLFPRRYPKLRNRLSLLL